MESIQQTNRSFFALLLLPLSILLALLISELAVRFFIPQNTYVGGVDYFDKQLFDLKANYHGSFACTDYRYTITTDKNRMRQTKNYHYSSRPLSILILGDSFAFGMGVNDTETLASVVSSNLHQSNIPALVSNAAVPGYTVTEEAAKYHVTKQVVYPDAVVVVSCFNDFSATLPLNGRIEESETKSLTASKPSRWSTLYPSMKRALLGHSQLAVLLAKRFNQTLIAAGIRDAFRGVMAAYDPAVYTQNKSAIDNVETVLHNLYTELENDSVPVIFVYVPGLLEVDDRLWQTVKRKTPSLDRDLAHRHIVEAARQAGFTTIISPLETASGKDSLRECYYPLDMHLNKKGHVFFGTLIAQTLREILTKNQLTIHDLDTIQSF